MDIKEFKQLSRQNNYRILNRKMPLASHKRQSLKDIMLAKQYNTLVIKRDSNIIGLIPLAKGHKIAEFTTNPPKVSKPEFNLIKEFTK